MNATMAAAPVCTCTCMYYTYHCNVGIWVGVALGGAFCRDDVLTDSVCDTARAAITAAHLVSSS